MAQGKTGDFFNRVDAVANAAIAKVDAKKKAPGPTPQELENRRLGPGIDRSRGGPRLEPAKVADDFVAVEPGANAGRRVFVPAHRNPVTGGSDRKRGGAKQGLAQLYA